MGYVEISRSVCEMVCPRCQASKFEDGVEGLMRCVRCHALVAIGEDAPLRVPVMHPPLREINFCET